jgi:hypothetical protein
MLLWATVRDGQSGENGNAIWHKRQFQTKALMQIDRLVLTPSEAVAKVEGKVECASD